MSALDRVLAKIPSAKRSGDDWQAKCPAHDDRHASLSIGEGEDGRVLLKCHAGDGCTVEEITRAMGLRPADLFDSNGAGPSRIVAAYDYEDEQGALLFQVVRKNPKQFPQRRPDGHGGWIWKLGKTRRVLFHLPRLIEAVKTGKTIYIAEGEKDVLALEEAGVVATCNPMGALKWREQYSKPLAGADVVIVRDRDEEGHKHAASVASSLAGIATSVRIVEAAEGKDAADHLAAGKTVDEFVDVTPEQAAVPTHGGVEMSVSGQIGTRQEHRPPRESLQAPRRCRALLQALRRHDRRTARRLALWTLHTHAIDAAEATPYINPTSPTKKAGKSRLLDVAALLVREPLPTGGASEAALFRSIGADLPTLLWDEVDTIFGPKVSRKRGQAGNPRQRVHAQQAVPALRRRGLEPEGRAVLRLLPEDVVRDRRSPGHRR